MKKYVMNKAFLILLFCSIFPVSSFAHRHHGFYFWSPPVLIGAYPVHHYYYPAYPVAAPPPAINNPQPLMAQNLPPVWYYCESLQTYYPYTTSCPTPWKTVPASPTN